ASGSASCRPSGGSICEMLLNRAASWANLGNVLYADRVLVARLCGVARRLAEIDASSDVAVVDLRSVTDRRDLIRLAVVVMTNSYPVNAAATALLRDAAGPSSLSVVSGEHSSSSEAAVG